LKNNKAYFEGRENTKLFYQSWIPDSGEFKASLIALHDWGSHSDRVKFLAKFFTEKQYAVYSFDFRGHWRNKGENPGHIESVDHVQKDILLFMDLVKEEGKDKKVFLMGHSFGGLMSLIYAIEHPGLPGTIASCPLLKFSPNLSFGKKVNKLIAKSFSKVSPTKTIKFTFDQNQLTSDLKILREYIADKNKLEVMSLKTAAEISNAMKYAIENPDNLLCPVFIQQAGNDKIVDINAVRQFHESIKSKDKRFKLYDGFLHDLWTEKGRALVFQDIFVWLEKHL